MPLASLRTLRTLPKALSFDDVDDYVEVPYSESLEISNSITITAWVCSHYSERIQHIFTRIPDSGDSIIFVRIPPSGVLQSQFRIEGTYYGGVAGSIGWHKWYHICVVRDRTEVKHYINGVYVGGYSVAEGSIDTVGLGHRIGVAGWGFSEYWNGLIASVLIYNRALNLSEIQHNYNNPLNPVTSGLVLWLDWTSIDIANGLWLDRSGYNNHGTIYGATEEIIIKSPVRKLNRVRLLNAVR